MIVTATAADRVREAPEPPRDVMRGMAGARRVAPAASDPLWQGSCMKPWGFQLDRYLMRTRAANLGHAVFVAVRELSEMATLKTRVSRCRVSVAKNC